MLFSAILIHDVLCLPCLWHPSGAHIIAVFQSLSYPFLIIHRLNFYLLLLISSLKFSISDTSSNSLLMIQSVLQTYLKYLSKASVLEDIDLILSLLFIFHVSQPYIKTGLTSVLYSLSLVQQLMLLVLLTRSSSISSYPSGLDYTVMDVLYTSTFLANCSSLVHKFVNILSRLLICFHCIIYLRIYSYF